jgi:hypothetical protein
VPLEALTAELARRELAAVPLAKAAMIAGAVDVSAEVREFVTRVDVVLSDAIHQLEAVSRERDAFRSERDFAVKALAGVVHHVGGEPTISELLGEGEEDD